MVASAFYTEQWKGGRHEVGMNDEKLIPGSMWRKLLGLLRSEFSFQTGGALYQLSETWSLCNRAALCLLVLTV